MARKPKNRSWSAWIICMCAAVMAPVPGTAQATETVLHSFDPVPKGGTPGFGILRDQGGNLYGTANGGRYGAGVLYKVDRTGKETVIHAFTGTDGRAPIGLAGDGAGSLYGTTSGGGAANAGVIFNVDSTGHETVL